MRLSFISIFAFCIILNSKIYINCGTYIYFNIRICKCSNKD